METTLNHRNTCYLDVTLSKSSRQETLQLLIDGIKESGIEFNAVAFTGMSGSLIAPQVADALNKDLILVRKESIPSHSRYKVEFSMSKEFHNVKYIIVDDMISTGATIRYIRSKIREEFDPTSRIAECVGIFLYHEDSGGVDSMEGVPVTSVRG